MRNSCCIILTVNLTDRKSFEKLPQYYHDIITLFSTESLPSFFVVGTKSDLVAERAVSVSELEKQSEELKAKYFETSAKKNENIDKLLAAIILEIETRFPQSSDQPQSPINVVANHQPGWWQWFKSYFV